MPQTGGYRATKENIIYLAKGAENAGFDSLWVLETLIWSVPITLVLFLSLFFFSKFDYIFDRGCFHVLLPADRQRYITKIKQILKDNGILFLKSFSDKEPRQEGPYKFSQEEITHLFNKHFKMDSIKETVYQGTLDPFPKALFIVMIKL